MSEERRQTMTNADVARVFHQIAIMLELEGANSFRIRAYREGARAIEQLMEPLATVAEREGGLASLRGIGKDLAARIRDLLATGTTPMYEELRARFPVALVKLTDLQGLGARRVRQLHDALGIHDHASLEAAARAGRLRDLPGFGEKMEQKILQSLAIAERWAGRTLLGGVWTFAHALADELRRVPGVEQVEIAGSFRRRKETVADLDFVVCGGDCDAIMDRFVGHPQVAEVLGRGDTKCSVRITMGLQVDLRHVPAGAFGAALLYFTGSKEHNIALRRIAIERGMSLNEYGLTRGGEVVASRTEEDLYRALDLAWIPPELREDQGEIELAHEGRLPRLLVLEDLRGDLHMHTTRSDGKNSLVEMVTACRDRGYAYCAITEHSQSLAFAGGFDEARVRQSVDEIAEVRRQVPGIEVLHGLEVDILADGTLDLADDALALLDWVTVSLHSRLEQPADVATERVLKALEHPAVCAMSHPSARVIGTRPGVALDFERVFERAAELGVAMEINAQPDRLDLDDGRARRAKEKGVRLVIDTDAHSTRELDMMRYGVFVARRAGLGREHVLNARDPQALREGFRRPATTPAIAATPPSPPSGPSPAAKAEPSAGDDAPPRPQPSKPRRKRS